MQNVFPFYELDNKVIIIIIIIICSMDALYEAVSTATACIVTPSPEGSCCWWGRGRGLLLKRFSPSHATVNSAFRLSDKLMTYERRGIAVEKVSPKLL